jgi:type IV pilus assembly protein PilB
MTAKRNIGDMLVREGLLSPVQLDEARRDQRSFNGRFSSALVHKNFITEKSLAEFYSRQFGFPILDLDSFEIDDEALKSISREACEKHLVVPVSKAGNVLVVAFGDPSNLIVRDDLAFITRCKIEVVIATESSIVKALDRYFKRDNKAELGRVVDEMENTDDALNFTNSLQAMMLDKSDGEMGPIVKFVNIMLAEAIKLKASDIHIEPYEKRLRIRYRVDGILHEKVQPPSGVAAGLASRIKIMSRLDIAERRRPQDGRLRVKTATGVEVDFRISVLPTLFGEKIVMRLLDKSNLKLDMRTLGFDAEDLNIFTQAINQPQGLVLVTGPTGSGKTTTLYSALSSINDPQMNISTAEDPVEFNLDGINQVQINSEIGFNFAEALRSFLRQDPDIILVGEIRDLETAEIAFKAASTGHLVLSTLHTNDAPATVSRLLDMGVQPYLITSTVTLIVAQRLAARVCDRCGVPVQCDPDVLVKAGVRPDQIVKYKLMKGEGCSNCNGTGLKGRVAMYELMKMTNKLRETILHGGSPVEIKRAAISDGMRSLRQAGLKKLREGIVPLDELLTTTVGDDAL